ncbi:MAG: rhodanese-like domain-containing protein [Gallionella sp.]|nr:rhodanese-like domain-containing protein [Gallionella sp.]
MQFITSNFFPISLAIMSGAMILWSMLGSRVRGIKDVDTNAALQLINHKNAIVLDVREPDEYKSGHLLNAQLIPLGKLNERIGELAKYKDKPVVVVCRSGNRSGTACVTLGKQGFTQAYNLTGGMMAWQKANLPTQK